MSYVVCHRLFQSNLRCCLFSFSFFFFLGGGVHCPSPLPLPTAHLILYVCILGLHHSPSISHVYLNYTSFCCSCIDSIDPTLSFQVSCHYQHILIFIFWGMGGWGGGVCARIIMKDFLNVKTRVGLTLL